MKWLTATLLCVTLYCHEAVAADWPRWRGPDNDGHVRAAQGELPNLAATPKIVWRQPVGHGLSSPVVAGGKVFHMDNQGGKEAAHAVDATSGRTLWSHILDDTFKDGHSDPGPRCTPVVDGDRVYVQSCRGKLRCLAVETGEPIWGVDFTKDFGGVFIGERGSAAGASRHGHSGTPLVHGDRLVVTAGGTNGASVVCLDKRTGDVVWKSQSDVAGYAAPVLATIAGVEQFVVFTAKGAIGLRADDGCLLWRVPVKTSFGRHCVTPVVVDDMVVVSSFQVGLMGIRVSGDANALSAEKAWTSKMAAINYASPVAVGSHLYGLGKANKLVCVDIRTGKITWSRPKFSSKRLAKGYAAFLVMGGRILVMADNGELIVFEAEPTQYREVGRLALCGRTWCHPAYADGRFYLRDEKELLCLDCSIQGRRARGRPSGPPALQAPFRSQGRVLERGGPPPHPEVDRETVETAH